MRVKEEFRKSGYFWLPSTPEHKVPGTLCIADGGKIELEVVGILEEKGKFVNAFNNDVQPETINGDIENHGYITLKNCFYRNRNYQLFEQISKSKIHAGTAILGAAFKGEEEISVNTLKFSIEGLSDWVGISGFTLAHEAAAKAIIIEYKLPEEISFNLNEKIMLKIGFSARVPSIPISKSATIEQKIHFKLVSDEPTLLDEFLTLAFRITTFIGYGINTTVGLDSVTATSNELMRDVGDGKKLPIELTVIYPSLPFTKEPPKIETSEMLFSFGTIRKNFEAILKNWFAAYEKIAPSLHLYFSATSGNHKYLENKFLALAQCLETYHRRTSVEKLMDENEFKELVETLIKNCPEEHIAWLTGRIQHGNELSLSQRVKEVIEPFKDLVGSSGERSKLIRAIVNTRNYLTHFNDALEADATTGQELWILCKRMEAIFQLHLLDVLSFTKDEIYSVHKNSQDLQKKLKAT
jgi:hypothetical protein